MTLDESRKQADEMFEELKEALVPKGWRCAEPLALRMLFTRRSAGRAMTVVRARTNFNHGDFTGIPSIRVSQLGEYWDGVGVKEAIERALSLGVAPALENGHG